MYHQFEKSCLDTNISEPIHINPIEDLLQALSPSSTSTLSSQASFPLSILLLHLHHHLQLQKFHLFSQFYLFASMKKHCRKNYLDGLFAEGSHRILDDFIGICYRS
ncbi:hypothetical protein VNO77_20922 [Canavalia gladiata]|uniref:Uncharacterized protein n=1 Tax=Canavalia gladiata TaxID=3824 RepID=A0AAN9LTP4_CANGL